MNLNTFNTTIFYQGSSYTKKDIYQLLDVPLSIRKGAWDTGYRKYNDSYYLFINIDTAGRTGHDYDNHWDGKFLIWHANTRSKLKQPSIQELISNKFQVHIFTRTNSRDAFTYQGTGKAIDFENSTPVRITWQLNNSLLLDIQSAWEGFLSNGLYAFQTKEVFYSPTIGEAYKIAKVTSKSLTIKTVSTTPQIKEEISFSSFKTSIEKLNTASGFLENRKMFKSIHLEAAVVWLLPMLDWDNEVQNVEVVPTEKIQTDAIYFSEATNDNLIKTVSRKLRVRRGQNKLRENLLYLYNNKCCISQFDVVEVLHACHISPHSSAGNNSSTNALLLRADIHDLFDNNLIAIQPDNLKIQLQSSISNSEYKALIGRPLAARKDGQSPDIEALKIRWSFFSTHV